MPATILRTHYSALKTPGAEFDLGFVADADGKRWWLRSTAEGDLFAESMQGIRRAPEARREVVVFGRLRERTIRSTVEAAATAFRRRPREIEALAAELKAAGAALEFATAAVALLEQQSRTIER